MSDLQCVLASPRSQKKKKILTFVPFVILLIRSFLCVGNMKSILVLPPCTKCMAVTVLVIEVIDVYLCSTHSLRESKKILYSSLYAQCLTFIDAVEWRVNAHYSQLQLFGFTRIIWGWSWHRSPLFLICSICPADLWPVCWCLEPNLLLSPAKLKDKRCYLPLQRGGKEHHCYNVFSWVHLYSAHGRGQQCPAGTLLRH